MPPQVSVAMGKKPKPKEGFKFLRRDEGRLSYSQQPVAAADSPTKAVSTAIATTPAAGELANRERRDSKSLREAIASDMRKAKSHDYFAEVVVAVPKKAPPPHVITPTTHAVSAGPPPESRLPGTLSGKSTTPARPQQRSAASRPPWVDPDIPPPARLGQGEAGVVSPSQLRPLRSPRRERESGWAAVEEYSAPRAYHPVSCEESVGNSRDGEARAKGRYGYDNYQTSNKVGSGGGSSASVSGPRREAVGGRRYADPAYGDDYDSYGTSHAVSLSAAEAQVMAAPVATAMGGNIASLSQAPHTSYGGADNYFHPARGVPEAGGARLPSRAREEEDLMLQLEHEVAAAQKEREYYMMMKQEVDRERQSFAAYRFSAQREIEGARAELKETQAQMQREAQKDVKSVTERYRSVSGLLSTERAANAKLMQENEALRTQLEELTTTMREMQLGHKTEVTRMRRDIESLTRRNGELLAMAKEQQIRSLEGNAVGSDHAELLVSAVPEVRAMRAPSLAGQPRSNSGGGGGSVRPMISAHTSASAQSGAAARSVSSVAPSRPSPDRATPTAADDTERAAESPSQVVVGAETGTESGAVGGDDKDEDDGDDAVITAARERRARAVEAHLRREEEERRRRRQQRERVMAERGQQRTTESQATKPIAPRGQRTEDSASRTSAAVIAAHDAQHNEPSVGNAKTSLRKDMRTTTSIAASPAGTREPQKASELAGATDAAQGNGADTTSRRSNNAVVMSIEAVEHESRTDTTANATDDVAQERVAAGHPLVTPRLTRPSTLPSSGGAGKTSLVSVARPPVVPRSRHIPTHDELIGDVEPVPSEELPNDAVVSQVTIGDNPNKREILYRSGKRVIHYSNGTIKTILPSGHTVLRFTNKDVKCTYPSGRSTYWYEAAQTTHTQQPDDVQIFDFHATGQTERHFPDGTKEILYPDGSFKIVHHDGAEETFMPDQNEQEVEHE